MASENELTLESIKSAVTEILDSKLNALEKRIDLKLLKIQRDINTLQAGDLRHDNNFRGLKTDYRLIKDDTTLIKERLNRIEDNLNIQETISDKPSIDDRVSSLEEQLALIESLPK